MSEFAIDNTATPAAEPATPTPAAPTSATPTPFAVTPATPSAPPQAPATGVPDGYVPSYRLRETREAALREARELLSGAEQRYQAQLEQMQQKIAALAGFAPQNHDPQTDAVRQQFSQLYPGLAKMEQRAADYERVLERAGDLESQTTHYWQSYGREQVNKLHSLASESVGTPLNDEAKRVLTASFIGFVQSSPEMQSRYEQDPTLVEDFWRSYQSNFIDPVRRAGAVSMTQRIPQGLPQDTSSGTPRATPAPQLNGLDERANASWAYFNQLRNQQ